jgi:hypothetical protein
MISLRMDEKRPLSKKRKLKNVSKKRIFWEKNSLKLFSLFSLEDIETIDQATSKS